MRERESVSVCVCARARAQSHVTLCGPVGRGPPGSSVHGIPQARVLAWVAISYSRASSRPRDQTHLSRWILYH